MALTWWTTSQRLDEIEGSLRSCRAMLLLLISKENIIMSDLTNLNAAMADLKAEVGAIGSEMDTLVADLAAAHKSGDQAAIDAATAAIREQVDALKTIGTRDLPPPPAP